MLTAPGEADLARTVLEDLGQRFNGLVGITWVLREKPPGFSRPFGNARFLLDVVLSSDDQVLIMAEAVQGWLRDQRRGVVLRATVATTSVDLSYPSSPSSPAALILQLVQEGRESLRNKIGLAYLRDLYAGTAGRGNPRRCEHLHQFGIRTPTRGADRRVRAPAVEDHPRYRDHGSC